MFDESFAAEAEARRRSGRPEEAEALIREGLRSRPDCLEARAVLCRALLDQGRTEELRRELEVVTDSLPAPDQPAEPLEPREPPGASFESPELLSDAEGPRLRGV